MLTEILPSGILSLSTSYIYGTSANTGSYTMYGATFNPENKQLVISFEHHSGDSSLRGFTVNGTCILAK